MRSVLMTVGSILAISGGVALGAGSGMPGDGGKPLGGDGIPPGGPRPTSIRPSPPAQRAPTIRLALKAVEAIAVACKQYPLGIAVVNSAGEPILVYVPDGSGASHGYTAVRKAYSATVYRVPTSEVTKKAQTDVEFASRVRSDPNLVAFGGGLPLVVNGTIVGAIGVSGAEPGGHDEECGLKGIEAIKSELQ